MRSSALGLHQPISWFSGANGESRNLPRLWDMQAEAQKGM